MLKKITLAAALALTVASGVAYAGPHGDNLRDRQNETQCDRPAAPDICNK